MKGLTLFIFGLTWLFATIFAQVKKITKPNILIILADDLGYHDVSYYGTKDVKTPNIDKLCNDGVRFDRFYSNSPVCAPTRASLLSGRYPEMIGVPGLIRQHADDNFGYMTPGVVLLPMLLKKAGYNTALVGKWNLGLESPNTPNEKGFDHFHGFLDDMMDDYYNHLRYGNNLLRLNKNTINPKGHATDLFTDWAISYLNSQKNKRNPFILYLAYTAPHIPIQPRQDWLAKVQSREKNITDGRAKLVALIEHLDDGIGKVIGTLRQNGQLENTLIFFLSDNGGDIKFHSYNGDLRDGKGTMYEGGIRVPAFVFWNNHIPAGVVISDRLMTMDILPTIAEITGAKTNFAIDGRSFFSLINGKAEALPERPLFFVRREGNTKFNGQTIQAIIHNNYKLLQNSPYESYELYNLAKDPMEKNNVIQSEKDMYLKLQPLLMEQIQKGGRVPWQKPATVN